jgi:very-short-patch-repair endonuclease
LKDEVRRNFELLAGRARSLAEALAPFDAAGLIPQGATPGQIDSVIALMEESGTIPPVPADWFVEPVTVAKDLLKRDEATQRLRHLRQELSGYVDNIESTFPDGLGRLSDLAQFRWLSSIRLPLGDTYTENVQGIGEITESLDALAENLGEVATAQKELVQAIKLPLGAELNLAALSKLAAAARLISDHHPLREAWFETDQAQLRIAQATQALAAIEAIERFQSAAGPDTDLRRVVTAVRSMPDLEQVQGQWDACRSLLKVPTVDSLLTLHRDAEQLQQQMQSLANSYQMVAEKLPLPPNVELGLRGVLALAKATVVLTRIGEFHTSWKDANVRHAVRSAAELAISDLTEAKELQLRLQEKLSHRAFQPAARLLINRSQKFRSWFGRVFGGFSKFRVQVADLYKASVPGPQELLEDLLQLQTYHKRLSGVLDTFKPIADHLPKGFVAQNLDGWTEIIEALRRFEQHQGDVAHVLETLATGSVCIREAGLDVSPQVVAASAETFSTQLASSAFFKLINLEMSLADALAQVSTLQTAAEQCLRAGRQWGEMQQRETVDFESVLTEWQAASGLDAHFSTLEALHEANRNALPEASASGGPMGFADPAKWHKLIAGFDVAEKLRLIFGGGSALRDVACQPGAIDRQQLGRAAERLQQELVRTEKLLGEVYSRFDLKAPHQQPVDVRRRSPADLSGCASAAAEELREYTALLHQLIGVTRPGCQVPLSDVQSHVQAVREIRVLLTTLDSMETKLAEIGVSCPANLTEAQHTAARWLLTVPEGLLKHPLTAAVATRPEWSERVSATLPVVRQQAADFATSWEYFGKLFDVAGQLAGGRRPAECTFGELAELARGWLSEIERVEEWVDFQRWSQEMQQSHLGVVVEELIAGAYLPQEAKGAVVARFYQQLLDFAFSTIEPLGGFDRTRHEEIRDQFQHLDKWEVKAAATRIREYQLNRDDRPRVEWMAPTSSELGILKRETTKKRRHLPLRRLFNSIPGVLQRLKPCIMMSPLSVSTFLESDAIRFDMVIFDEASQVFPWDAIGAIYRGTQLIVAGDEKQLPPTSFFSRTEVESEEDDDEDLADFESILSVCKSVNMPNKRLRWHYRSRREPLIAFSNTHFYDGDLVTFPSVRDASQDAVRLEFVPEGRWINRRNTPEAQRVADLVIEHFRHRPKKSLGVIAFNISQQQAIEDALYDRQRKCKETDALLSSGPAEPLFIKNLENVQGDERDVIIMSFGYGLNESGKFIKNFGPLTKQGGERRLNVAVTRAREAVILAASVRSSQMDLKDSTSVGAQLLKGYLEYAEKGVDTLGRAIAHTTSETESPFEAEVAEALLRHGLEPVPQVGCGGFRIDLALRHPDHSGVYCLGIECDGATYHSSKSARDRDRLRQAILENLGWRTIRIWSTDWVRNPGAQLTRVLEAYREAAAQAPVEDWGHHVEVEEPDVSDLQPTVVTAANAARQVYASIEDVPTAAIEELTIALLSRSGAADWDELIKLTGRELGFNRTGSRIRDRIENVLSSQLQVGRIQRFGERVTIVAP